jgi:allantoin racemase
VPTDEACGQSGGTVRLEVNQVKQPTRRIRVVVPIITKGFGDAGDFSSAVGSGTEITLTQIERGPASIESEFDAALAAPDVVLKIVEAECEGVDAAIIDCMDDPGLLAAREMVSIPVLGPCQTTMHLASLLGHRFSVVTAMESSAAGFENRAKLYGVAEKLASVRWVDIPVLDLSSNENRLLHNLIEESVKAVVEDGAHVVVFGCTGLLGHADAVRQGLERRGHEGIPVIDPMPATIRFAEMLVDAKLRHSKRTYPFPRAKAVAGYEFAHRERQKAEEL